VKSCSANSWNGRLRASDQAIGAADICIPAQRTFANFQSKEPLADLKWRPFDHRENQGGKVGSKKMRRITYLIAGAILALCSVKANAQYGTPEDAVVLVQRTIAAIERDGVEAVVDAVNRKDPRFRDRDLYVFIGDLNVPGQLIAHGVNVKLTEKNTIDIKDENGKYFAREMWEVVRAKGSGWVDYRWANADRTQFADKTSYVQRVGDYFVSVGVYKIEAPNDNTVGIISGNPYSAPTYLQFAYDMAAVLNDGSNLRIVPVVGMGGVQNIRDVQSLKGGVADRQPASIKCDPIVLLPLLQNALDSVRVRPRRPRQSRHRHAAIIGE
jgi:hypothetical protein